MNMMIHKPINDVGKPPLVKNDGSYGSSSDRSNWRWCTKYDAMDV